MVILNDFLLECFENYRIFQVSEKKITFENDIVYAYEEGQILELDFQPESSCHGYVIPSSVKLLESDRELYVSTTSSGTFGMDDEEGKFFRMEPKVSFKKKHIDRVTFFSTYIRDILVDNSNKFCKIYLKNDFPICFEFHDKKIFVAPIVQDLGEQ